MGGRRGAVTRGNKFRLPLERFKNSVWSTHFSYLCSCKLHLQPWPFETSLHPCRTTRPRACAGRSLQIDAWRMSRKGCCFVAATVGTFERMELHFGITARSAKCSDGLMIVAVPITIRVQQLLAIMGKSLAASLGGRRLIYHSASA